MRVNKIRIILALTAGVLTCLAAVPAAQAQAKKPNIVVIMGDDIGMWNIGAYHRSMMADGRPLGYRCYRQTAKLP